jgi:DNA sulfur modification protein DndB
MLNLSTTIMAMPAGGADSPKTTTGTVRDLQALTIPITEMIAKKPSASYRYAVEEIASVRDLVQRDMTGAKGANARTKLPDYIAKRLDGSGRWTGPVWTFTVWLPQALEDMTGEGTTRSYRLEHSNRGFCLDGESRGYSLEKMILEEPDPRRREALLNIPIFLNIYDGIDAVTAAQHFRDINGLGVGINASLLLGHDYADPWMRVTRKVFADLGVGIEEEGRQVKAASDKVLTVVAARGMVAAVARGISAVTYGGGAIPEVEIDEDNNKRPVDFERLTTAATTWLTHVFSTLGVESFRDKGKVLRAAPVIAALGALGRPFYDGSLDEQLAAKAALASIPDWSAGERWNGIAGKITPSGAFSVGSGKEAGHSTFRAIKEPSDPGYSRIRGIA